MRLLLTVAGAVGVLTSSVYAQATQPATHAKGPVVDLGYLKYHGFANRTAGIKYFRGIQYAVSIQILK